MNFKNRENWKGNFSLELEEEEDNEGEDIDDENEENFKIEELVKDLLLNEKKSTFPFWNLFTIAFSSTKICKRQDHITEEDEKILEMFMPKEKTKQLTLADIIEQKIKEAESKMLVDNQNLQQSHWHIILLQFRQQTFV